MRGKIPHSNVGFAHMPCGKKGESRNDRFLQVVKRKSPFMLFNVFRNQDASDPFLAFSPSCRFEHFSEFPISYGGRTHGKAEGGREATIFSASPPPLQAHTWAVVKSTLSLLLLLLRLYSGMGSQSVPFLLLAPSRIPFWYSPPELSLFPFSAPPQESPFHSGQSCRREIHQLFVLKFRNSIKDLDIREKHRFWGLIGISCTMNLRAPGAGVAFGRRAAGYIRRGGYRREGKTWPIQLNAEKKPVSEILEGRRKEEEEGRYYFYYVQPSVCTTKALGARSALLKKPEFGRWK